MRIPNPRSGELRRKNWFRWLLCGIGLLTTVGPGHGQVPDVFLSSDSEYSESLAEGTATEVIRTIHVEERAGVRRQGELVRVPLFFAAGECPSLDGLVIAAGDDTAAGLNWQPDDVRRAADGGISRMHLWFAVDLAPGEKRKFQLLRRTNGAAPAGRTSAKTGDGVETTADEIRFKTERGWVVFSRDGRLRSLGDAPQRWDFGEKGASSQVELKFPAKEGQAAATVVFGDSAQGRDLQWSDGALFHKLRIRDTKSDGTAFEQEFRIPRHGRAVIVTTAIFPGTRTGIEVKQNNLLNGVLERSSGAPKVTRVPAGIRHALRSEHAYTLTALTRSKTGDALLAVPLAIGGSNGLWVAADDGTVTLRGLRGLRRGEEGEKNTLNAFWTEVRLVPVKTTEVEALWRAYRERVQPLVAVVEEPGATVERFHTTLSGLVREMKPIGWRQEAARAWVMDDEARMGRLIAHGPKPREADAESLARGARNAYAKLSNDGKRKLAEHEKGRGYGGLDPYHITYSQSAAAGLAVLADVPAQVSAINHAMARAVREVGGKVDTAGSPYIDCFNRTLNMQMGPMLFGLTAGAKAGDIELAQFYRDLATAPPVLAVFGRAQRPYTGAPAKTPDQTDYLYQAICDFWLRTTELLGNENLGLHPMAYARYTDCVDVTADRYHGVASRDKPGAGGQARANFFRGQAHTHRWLGWASAPYIRLLEEPAERASVGLTEAIHHTQLQKGRWKNWPDLTYYALADMLVREGLERYVRPELPAAPEAVTTHVTGGRAELSWPAVPGAAAYRIYRAKQPGGPYRWLNSPHAETSPAPLTGTHFIDTEPGENPLYVVKSVDAEGRESAWRDQPE